MAIPGDPDRAAVFAQVTAIAVAAATLLKPGSQLREEAYSMISTFIFGIYLFKN